jgi:transcription-repair coupling factor (superfamily II helicase)
LENIKNMFEKIKTAPLLRANKESSGYAVAKKIIQLNQPATLIYLDEDQKFLDRMECFLSFILEKKISKIYNLKQNNNVIADRTYNNLSTIYQLISNQNNSKINVILSKPEAIFNKYPAKQPILQSALTLKKGDIVDSYFSNILIEYSYERNDTIRSFGEFAIRGEIIDISCMENSLGYRIHLDNDRIDKITLLDLTTQLSIQEEYTISIIPIDIKYFNLTENIISLLEIEYLFVQSLEMIEESYRQFQYDLSIFKQDNSNCQINLWTEEEITNIFQKFQIYTLPAF